jgi:hypothetical protein
MERDSTADEDVDFPDSEVMVPARVLQTGPGTLL